MSIKTKSGFLARFFDPSSAVFVEALFHDSTEAPQKMKLWHGCWKIETIPICYPLDGLPIGPGFGVKKSN